MNLYRMALGIRYDGTDFHGWQHQQGLRTIQGAVEQALSRVANHPVQLYCAGRTDAGVHACQQVAHFDTDAYRSEYSWVFGTNSNLPNDISITWIKFVSKDFHARFSAKMRRYRYVIYNNSVRPGILRHAVAWYFRTLDADKMHIAGQHLLGEHDFSAFRGAGCQSTSPVRMIYDLSVKRYESMIFIEIAANAFLLHMVRNIVGVLVVIGSGDKPPEWSLEVLHSRERRFAAATAAPHGLYLIDVKYPQEYDLPYNAIEPFFLP